jgi:hypothetical protein
MCDIISVLLRLDIAEIRFDLIDPESLTIAGNKKRRQKRGLRLAAEEGFVTD